ncbi:hypothetical protein KAH94_06390, partial [bacterium]|nr:hypothetical protein [bacterium]
HTPLQTEGINFPKKTNINKKWNQGGFFNGERKKPPTVQTTGLPFSNAVVGLLFGRKESPK